MTDDLKDSPLFRHVTTQPVTASPVNGKTGRARGVHSLAGPITPAKPRPHRDTFDALGPNSDRLPDWATTEPADDLDGPAAVSVDYDLVREIRLEAAKELGKLDGVTGEERRTRGMQIIRSLVRTRIVDDTDAGRAWTLTEQEALVQAIFEAQFEMGRLQRYLDDPTIENIIIAGSYLNVWIERSDGTLTRVPPVASSDEDLLDYISAIAERPGEEVSHRPFSRTHPCLDLRLPDGSRLAASGWVTAGPSIVIRRHRLKKVMLDDLVALGMLSDVLASFLKAAVRARKSIVVSGPQGAGKTTLVRALANEFDYEETVGTFETEFELFLHEQPDLHAIVLAWESRPGTGEFTPDGLEAGAFNLDEALYRAARYNLSRFIVGEVRGRETWAMIKAMEQSSGCISTTHAYEAKGAIQRLLTLAMEAGPSITHDLAMGKLSQVIDLIVQIDVETIRTSETTAQKNRWISEVIHVTPGERFTGVATTHVFQAPEDTHDAVPHIMPHELRRLEKYGFDYNGFLATGGHPQKEDRP